MKQYAMILNRHSKYFSSIGKIVDSNKSFGVNFLLVEIKDDMCGEDVFYLEKFPEYDLLCSDNLKNLEDKSKVYKTFI